MSASKKAPRVTITTLSRTTSEDSDTFARKSPRTPRFVEATTVYSPLEPSGTSIAPFSQALTSRMQYQSQPSRLGIEQGKEKDPLSVEMTAVSSDHLTRNAAWPSTPLFDQPLKSALKTPGTARNMDRMFSATFQEEEYLEKQEEDTEQEQAKDLKVKTRVRMAKFLLRGVNFSCSLIVLSMLSYTMTIFRATKSLPARSSLPPWAVGQQTWPQITLLVIACISLALSLCVFYAYWKGGHNRAQKTAVYYTTFAVACFVFSTVMWITGGAVLGLSKKNGNKQDLWGWACNDNKRRTLFQNEVDYALICRLQSWSLLCAIIEIVVEVITISIYGVIFYRYFSKRRLRKSMARRDGARSDLYLAQLRSQSAPNTPGFNGPFSPRDGGYKAPIDYYAAGPSLEDGVEEDATYIDVPNRIAQPKPFVLQPPPARTGLTPKMAQTGFTPIPRGERTGSPQASTQRALSRTPSPPQRVYSYSPEPLQQQQQQHHQQHQEHFGAAPGEEEYEAVPIPGAYVAPSASPLQSPSFAPRQMNYGR